MAAAGAGKLAGSSLGFVGHTALTLFDKAGVPHDRLRSFQASIETASRRANDVVYTALNRFTGVPGYVMGNPDKICLYTAMAYSASLLSSNRSTFVKSAATITVLTSLSNAAYEGAQIVKFLLDSNLDDAFKSLKPTPADYRQALTAHYQGLLTRLDRGDCPTAEEAGLNGTVLPSIAEADADKGYTKQDLPTIIRDHVTTRLQTLPKMEDSDLINLTEVKNNGPALQGMQNSLKLRAFVKRAALKTAVLVAIIGLAHNPVEFARKISSASFSAILGAISALMLIPPPSHHEFEGHTMMRLEGGSSELRVYPPASERIPLPRLEPRGYDSTDGQTLYALPKGFSVTNGEVHYEHPDGEYGSPPASFTGPSPGSGGYGPPPGGGYPSSSAERLYPSLGDRTPPRDDRNFSGSGRHQDGTLRW